eukprot:TRINITY_DN50361_c0_g1_i2.p1 TRINITY_DN50361_c0_g1~~TRINITY_DN50361_c0_g1_i2.p1  ORF type:complete len:120 (-),score=5.34 TRINITY_DN50361_c0_g1_i2:43-402(-)
MGFSAYRQCYRHASRLIGQDYRRTLHSRFSLNGPYRSVCTQRSLMTMRMHGLGCLSSGVSSSSDSPSTIGAALLSGLKSDSPSTTLDLLLPWLEETVAGGSVCKFIDQVPKNGLAGAEL